MVATEPVALRAAAPFARGLRERRAAVEALAAGAKAAAAEARWALTGARAEATARVAEAETAKDIVDVTCDGARLRNDAARERDARGVDALRCCSLWIIRNGDVAFRNRGGAVKLARAPRKIFPED